MGLACGVGKRRRQKQHIKRQLGAEKLRKTHVVANALRHRDAVNFQLRHFSTSLYRIRFLIRFSQTLKTKQMHFVVAPYQFTVAIISEHGVQHLVVIATLQRNGATDDDHAQTLGRGRQKILQHSLAKRLGKRQFIGVFLPHNRPVFGQQRPLSTLCSCLL